MNELDKIAPSFNIQGSQIQVIKTPADFYDTLKAKIRKARKRIFLSTLYIGKSEKDLVQLTHFWRLVAFTDIVKDRDIAGSSAGEPGAQA